MYSGKTWGERMLDHKWSKRNVDPAEYFIGTFDLNAGVLQARINEQEQYSNHDSRSYYMNDPSQQDMKPLLSELGRWAPPQIQGMSNMHSQLSDASTRMYQRRIVHGMT